tara:strand:+ start:1110 stop:1523 length:414 start_codon:yes stop_codon:yes gene_type:complete
MFFNQKKNDDDTDFIKVASLLIHAAKIDENYSNDEEEIIKKTLISLGVEKNKLNTVIMKAKQYEEDVNQILDFTREIKNLEEKNKIKIIKSLWKIIYSDKDADIYETNLMRRLAGLLYIDSKIMGDIKEEIKKENLK